MQLPSYGYNMGMFQIKFLISLHLGLALLVASPSLAEVVCSNYDGDTLKLCNGVSVRLAGIDAPELRQANGKQSRDHLAKMVKGQDVRLECTGKSYQRQVCRVFKGSLDIQKEMVGWGWAFDSPKYSKGLYQGAESFARKNNRGVWLMPDGGQKPWDYRHRK